MISSDPNSVRPETKKKVIIINHKNDDWNLEVHGGIKMWVNAAGEGFIILKFLLRLQLKL